MHNKLDPRRSHRAFRVFLKRVCEMPVPDTGFMEMFREQVREIKTQMSPDLTNVMFNQPTQGETK